jgi:hypothetical protein
MSAQDGRASVEHGGWGMLAEPLVMGLCSRHLAGLASPSPPLVRSSSGIR